MNEKYKLFRDWERPPLFREVAERGQGFSRLRRGHSSYLIRYTEEGTPHLMGRMVEKFRKVGNLYVAAYLPAEYFSASEKAALEESLLEVQGSSAGFSSSPSR